MEFPDRQYTNLAGFRFTNKDGKYQFFVLAPAFTGEICTGLIRDNVTKTLIDRGYLLPNATTGKAYVSKRLPGVGQARVYHINPAIFEDGDEFETVEETEDQQ